MKAIRTIDTDSFPLSGGRGRNMRRTRDDSLTGPEPVTRISLAKVWRGDNGDPLVELANYATAAFAEGCFAPDQVLHAEALENVISLGKLWIGQLEAVQEKLASKDQGHGPAADKPVTADAATPRSRLFGGGKATPASQYQDALRKGRETSDRGAPAKVVTVADYAATLRAGRAKR